MIGAFPGAAVDAREDHRRVPGEVFRRRTDAPEAEGPLLRPAILRRVPPVKTEMKGKGARILDPEIAAARQGGQRGAVERSATQASRSTGRPSRRAIRSSTNSAWVQGSGIALLPG